MKDMLKNIINKTYFKVAIINLVIFGIANIFFNIKYEQVDDMIIYSLYSGLDSTYNIHGIYIYPLICLVLSNLYKICSIINWHTVLLLSMKFICFTVIGTILLKNKSSKVGYILYTIFASICYTSLLLLIQYTSVSALLIATAFFIIFDMQEEKSFSKRKKVFADILFVLGIMIRLQSLMIILPFFIVYLVYIILKNKRTLKISEIKELVKQYIILFILTILIYSSNIIFYNTNSLYKNYIEYNELRTKLQDLSYTDYEENKEIFNEIGWSKNDHYLFYTFNYGDENTYSKENLEKIVKYKKDNGIEYNLNTNFKSILEQLIRQLVESNELFTIIFLVAFILVLCLNKNKTAFSIIILLTTIGINVLFIVLNRAMLRVVIPEYILGTAILLYFVKYKDKEKDDIGGILVFIVLSVVLLSANKYNFNYKLENYSNYQEVIEYTNSHKENVYLYTAPALQFRYLTYSVYSMPPKGAFSNLRVMGGWDIFTENYYEFKQRNSLDGTFFDLLKENVYLIDGDVEWSGVYYENYKEHVIQFIKEHYGKNVKCEKIKTFDNIYIYKLTEENI